jgi:hypothetical protein
MLCVRVKRCAYYTGEKQQAGVDQFLLHTTIYAV